MLKFIESKFNFTNFVKRVEGRYFVFKILNFCTKFIEKNAKKESFKTNLVLSNLF